MADYDLIARMNGCFNELEIALHDLGIFWGNWNYYRPGFLRCRKS